MLCVNSISSSPITEPFFWCLYLYFLYTYTKLKLFGLNKLDIDRHTNMTNFVGEYIKSQKENTKEE